MVSARINYFKVSSHDKRLLLLFSHKGDFHFIVFNCLALLIREVQTAVAWDFMDKSYYASNALLVDKLPEISCGCLNRSLSCNDQVLSCALSVNACNSIGINVAFLRDGLALVAKQDSRLYERMDVRVDVHMLKPRVHWLQHKGINGVELGVYLLGWSLK